jgi:hypothetical protein
VAERLLASQEGLSFTVKSSVISSETGGHKMLMSVRISYLEVQTFFLVGYLTKLSISTTQPRAEGYLANDTFERI